MHWTHCWNRTNRNVVALFQIFFGTMIIQSFDSRNSFWYFVLYVVCPLFLPEELCTLTDTMDSWMVVIDWQVDWQMARWSRTIHRSTKNYYFLFGFPRLEDTLQINLSSDVHLVSSPNQLQQKQTAALTTTVNFMLPSFSISNLFLFLFFHLSCCASVSLCPSITSSLEFFITPNF